MADKHYKKQLISTSNQFPKFEEEPPSDDLDDTGTIFEAIEEEPDDGDEPEAKPDTKLDPPPPTTKIKTNQSERSSGLKKTKKISPAKIQIPPPKPRLKRNQTTHLKIGGKFKCNFCEKCKQAYLTKIINYLMKNIVFKKNY